MRKNYRDTAFLSRHHASGDRPRLLGPEDVSPESRTELPEFEEAFARYIGTKFAVAVNSGTSGLHLCVKSLSIGARRRGNHDAFQFHSVGQLPASSNAPSPSL